MVEESKYKHPRLKHGRYYKERLKREQEFKDGVEGINYVTCKICNIKQFELRTHLPIRHNISEEEYKLKYPGALTCRIKTRQKRIENNCMNRPEIVEKISIAMKGKPSPLKGKSYHDFMDEDKAILRTQRISKGNNGKHHTEETKKRISIIQSDPEFKKRVQKSLLERPTSLESQLIAIIQKYNLPFQYTGDKRFNIKGKSKQPLNPDFIHNSEQVCIDINGSYWHSQNITGRTREEEEQHQIDSYAQNNWHCIVVWDYELQDEEQLLNKLTKFENRGDFV